MIIEEKDLDYRKIKNFLRKHSSNVGDDYQLKKLLLQMFYYDIDGFPIAKLKQEIEIDLSKYPYYFQNKTRNEIIDIYNKEVKSSSLIKILTEEELNDYDIKDNIRLDISLKTFRPVYNKEWRKISEEVNNYPMDKQKSFYAEYLRCYIKIHNFPTFHEFLKYLFNKNHLPIHKDIKIVFDNIENSYKEVKEYIKKNNMTYEEVRKIIINSTPIKNRIFI